MRPDTEPPTGRLRMALILGSLSAFAPVSIDLYLPALPQLSRRFNIGESSAGLTLTACLAGLALGQLLAGPCSDALGRRRPLLLGLAIYALASAGCALAPTVSIFIGLRLVQGLAGAAGLVITRAVVRDLYDGAAMARFLSILMLVNGAAPIVSPLLGSQLMRVMSWQGLFWLLASYGLVLLLCCLLGLPETLATEARHTGGLRATRRVLVGLTGDRYFVGYALACGMVFAAMFSYIAGSPFVLQRSFGLSPQLFGVLFGINGLGIVLFGQLNKVLVGRFEVRPMLLAGLLLAVAGGVVLLVGVLAGLGLPVLLPGLFMVVGSMGLVQPNGTALAMVGRPNQAGSASALLGMLQFLFGAIAAPLAGVSGSGSALPMALLMSGLTVAALGCFVVLTR